MRALPSALVLFGIMAAHALLETARDALFLVKLGPDQLAWAYVAIAGVAVLAVAGLRRWSRGRALDASRRALLALLGLAAAGTAGFAATLTVAEEIVFALYVWTGLVATLIVPTFWSAIDRSLQIGDARRLFAAIGAGGVLGALAGSVLAIGVAALLGTKALVWVSAAILALTAGAAAALVERPTAGIAPAVARPRARRATARNARRYTRVLLALGFASTVTLTLADLMFKRVVAERFGAGADLATVFGAVYAGLNLLGLIVQLVATARMLDRFGVAAVLTVLPALVLASALGFALTGAALAVVALKLGDGGLRHSLHRVATEILFVPLPHATRDAHKPLIEAIGQRGGQAVAAVGTFLLASGGGGTTALAVLTVTAAAGWLAAIAVARRHYVQLFRDTLDAGEIARDVSLPALDARSIEVLTAALASPDESEALAALDLLARRGPGGAGVVDRVPALVLYHPSSRVVRRALSLLEGAIRGDVERVLRHLVSHADPQIRAAALAASGRTGCLDCLAAALTDPEPEVRAAAAVGLLGSRREPTPAIAALVGGTVAERVALAHALGRAPQPTYRPILDALLARRETAVMREVLQVWARAPELATPEKLIGLLEDPHLRGEVRRVVVAGGTRYFEPLLAALDDPRTPIAVRRHLPRTLSRFNSPAAVTALLARLVREPDGTTEFKILRALGRMRSNDPAPPVDPAPLHGYVKRTSDDAIRYAAFAQQLEGADSSVTLQLLRELLVEKRSHAIERVFRALGILHPRADLRSVHDAITRADPARRDAAREILENLVPVGLRLPVFAALAERAPSARITGEQLFAALLVDPSDSLRCIAAHHVAEQKLIGLGPELSRLRPYASPLVGHAFDQALHRLTERTTDV